MESEEETHSYEEEEEESIQESEEEGEQDEEHSADTEDLSPEREGEENEGFDNTLQQSDELEQEQDDSIADEPLQKRMCRMEMNFSRVKIVHSQSIKAIQRVTSDDLYTLARLKRSAFRYTSEEEAMNTDDVAAALSSMLYGDEFGPLIPEGSLKLEIDDHVAAAMVVVLERETEIPLITYAMTHRLHKRNGCMSVVMRLALSALKMGGHDLCAVVVNEDSDAAVGFFESFDFKFVGQD